LIQDSNSFAFRHMEGTAGLFPEAVPKLSRGEVVSDLGASTELSFRNGVYLVSVWDPEGLTVERYQFSEFSATDRLLLTGFEDANGVGLDFDYDNGQRLVAIRQRLEQRSLGIAYTQEQLIASISVLDRQSWRRLVSYTYDSNDRLIRVENAVGATEEYQYDSDGRLLIEKTKSGAVFWFVYDNRGRCIQSAGPGGFDSKTLVFKDNIGLTEVTDSLGHVIRYQWNEKGQVVNAINAAGEVTTTKYDEYGRIQSRIFPGGRSIGYEYDDAGNRKTVIDPLGRTLKFSFNDRHQVTELTDPRGSVWKSKYDTAGRWISHTTPLGNEWKFDYDDRGNLTGTTDPRGFHSQLIYRWPEAWEYYDYAGNVTTIAEDCMGRVVRRVEPSLKVTNYTRDAFGRLIGISTSTGTCIQYGYDSAGNITFIRDSLGATITFRFGTCRRLLERIDAVGSSRKFHWGTEPGRLLEIINEQGEIHKMEYDAAGRVVQETTFSGSGFRYEYDSNGFQSAYIDEAGNRTDYTRDAAGQLIAARTQDGEVTEYEYDALGDVTRASSSGGAIEFTRDPHGRVVREIQAGITIDFAFDPAGCLTRIYSGTGTEITFGYDANALPVSAKINGKELWNSRRNAQGLEIERRIAGGLKLHQRFDLNSSLQFQQLSGADGSSLIHRSFAYDVADRLTTLKDSRWGDTRYSYDAAEQIIAGTSAQTEEEFAYDAAGNLKSIGTDSVRVSLEYAAGNRLVQADGSRLDYDLHGRLIRQQTSSGGSESNLKLMWNGMGRLISVSSPDGEWQYRYDAIGRRLEKKGPTETVRFIWAGDVLLQEAFSSGRRRTWVTPPGMFSPLALMDGQQSFAIISDGNGTPRDVIGSNGKMYWAAAYAAWGAVKSFRGELNDFPIRFPGHYFDRETGFHYSRFRYYHPGYGRFISPDPIGLSGGLNEYAYVPNPLGWVDPLGLIIVYRNLRPEQDPSQGLDARRPGRGMTPIGHVMNASNKNFKGSQYMSATTDPAVAAEWREPGQTTVKFDTDHVVPDREGNLSILDISDREKAIQNGLKGRTINRAASSKEVLIEGHVPPGVIEIVPPPEEEEKSC
jgi:RHS repeat-associated protein